jgi:hypothetical protein
MPKLGNIFVHQTCNVSLGSENVHLLLETADAYCQVVCFVFRLVPHSVWPDGAKFHRLGKKIVQKVPLISQYKRKIWAIFVRKFNILINNVVNSNIYLEGRNFWRVFDIGWFIKKKTFGVFVEIGRFVVINVRSLLLTGFNTKLQLFTKCCFSIRCTTIFYDF